MPGILAQLNGGASLAFHMANLALQKHLNGTEVMWSNIQIIEENRGDRDIRNLRIGRGLVHVPGQTQVVVCIALVEIRKKDRFWTSAQVVIKCEPFSVMDILPLGVEATATYYCAGMGWDPVSPHVLLPTRRAHFPMPA